MFPGVNQRQMKQMMKKMGMQQQEIDATEVIIKTDDKDLVILNPSVSKINMMGQETFQIVGEIHEREKVTEIDADDIKTVMDQAEVDEKTARSALEKSNGDIAEAILTLQES